MGADEGPEVDEERLMKDLMLEWIEESFPKESDVDRSGRVGPSSSRESFGMAGMM